MTEDANYHEFINICCTSCGHRIDVPIYCGNRFCPICSPPRLARVRKRMDFMIKNVQEVRGYGIKFLTLTIPNQANLADMCKFILKSFRRLRQRAYWKRCVLGGCFVIEITGTPGNWHVHLHMAIHSAFMTYSKLMSLWTKVSGGRGVWITRIPSTAVVGYLTKYLTKAGTSDSLTQETSDALKGFRLFQPFGSFYAISLKYVQPPGRCRECGREGTLDLYYNVTGMGDFTFIKWDVDPRESAPKTSKMDFTS